MITLLRSIAGDSLYRSSFLILIASLVGGILNYIFNPVMGRLLTPIEYSELVTALALTTILSVPSGAISLAVAKYTSQFSSQNSPEKIALLRKILYRKIFLGSLLIFSIYLLFLPFLKSYFHFTTSLSLLAVGMLFVISSVIPIGLGILQGLKRFNAVSGITILGSLFKLISGTLVIFVGFRVTGVIFGLTLGSIIFFLIVHQKTTTLLPRFPSYALKIRKEFLEYTGMTFLTNLAFVLLLNADILLIKHYFSSEISGYYSVVSLLGKSIFYFGGSIGMVFFPLVSEQHTNGRTPLPLLKKSLLAIVVISIISVILFAVGDSLIIRILFGPSYLALHSLLWLAGILFSLYSVIYLLGMYFLAIHHKKFLIVFYLAALSLFLFTSLFHVSILRVMSVFITTFLSTLIGLFIFVFQEKNRPRIKENILLESQLILRE